MRLGVPLNVRPGGRKGEPYHLMVMVVVTGDDSAQGVGRSHMTVAGPASGVCDAPRPAIGREDRYQPYFLEN